jgi:hypothetical protein
MTASEFSDKYDRNYPAFEWFIKQYVPVYIPVLKAARDSNDFAYVYNILSDIWYRLPDNKFNIKVMPKGWREFLDTIEE